MRRAGVPEDSAAEGAATSTAAEQPSNLTRGVKVSTGRPDWALAACSGMDSDLFFPIGETGPSAIQIERAKTVCGRCPIMAECRAWAIATAQADGVWGGLSTVERRHRWMRLSC